MSTGEPVPALRDPTLIRGKLAFWIIVPAGVVLDGWSKSAAFDFHTREMGLQGPEMPYQVFDTGFVSLSIVRSYNSGMAFGLLQNMPDAHAYLAVVRGAAILLLVWMLRRTTTASITRQLALGALVAGAAGNLCDNLFQSEPGFEHAVRDFLLVAFGDWRFPAFNVADLLVSTGAIAYCIALALIRRPKSPRPAQPL